MKHFSIWYIKKSVDTAIRSRNCWLQQLACTRHLLFAFALHPPRHLSEQMDTFHSHAASNRSYFIIIHVESHQISTSTWKKKRNQLLTVALIHFYRANDTYDMTMLICVLALKTSAVWWAKNKLELEVQAHLSRCIYSFISIDKSNLKRKKNYTNSTFPANETELNFISSRFNCSSRQHWKQIHNHE